MSRLLFIGNFVAPHSTENELRKAFEHLGWEAHCIEERSAIEACDTGGGFSMLVDYALEADLVLYVASQGLPAPKLLTLYKVCDRAAIPTASFHLDLFHGLASPKGTAGIQRNRYPFDHPMFRAAFNFTADGGHDEWWRDAHVNHHWLPPAVSEWECELGTYREEFASDVAFVGSWQGHYHPESTHRPALVAFLRDTYGKRCKFWPHPRYNGGHAIRGQDLRDLYASVKVVVGDSCMIGMQPIPRYCSDRIPETLGRGGFLLHPWTEGITDDCWQAGVHLMCWEAGDWDGLRRAIDTFVDDRSHRQVVAAAGRLHTIAHHTYTNRVRTMLEVMGL